MRRALFAVALWITVASDVRAQLTTRSVGWGDAVSTVVSSALFLSPHIFKLNQKPPSCAPCDRANVPAFDRWSITEPRQSMRTLSTAGLVAIGLVSWIDLSRSGEAGRDEIAASVQSLTWTAGVSEMLKAVVKRKRPILYTNRAVDAAAAFNSQRSWPSEHTSAAFALATSYALSTKRVSTQQAGVAAGLVLAASVGIMRIFAGSHFTSDVVSGAAIGSLTTVAVHAIKF